MVEDHEVFQRIAPTTKQRIHCYRELIHEGLNDRDVYDVRKAVSFSMPLGDSYFKAQIEATLGKSIGNAKRGKAKKVELSERVLRMFRKYLRPLNSILYRPVRLEL